MRVLSFFFIIIQKFEIKYSQWMDTKWENWLVLNVWTGYNSAFIRSTAQHVTAEHIDTIRHDATRRDTRQRFVSSSFTLHTFLPSTATNKVNEQQWRISGMHSNGASCHWNGRHAFSSLLQKRENIFFFFCNYYCVLRTICLAHLLTGRDA